MAQFTDCRFDGITQLLDGNEFLRCQFKNCRIIVTRGNFSLHSCSFDTCVFEFAGEAANIRDLVVGLVNQGLEKAQAPLFAAATAATKPGDQSQNHG